ncbi:MAG: hypothetical protein Q8M02_15595 [Candidatus Didemnitutus sp.]|nr:hypothetical protein [Candidatus Didemnitutus sp.]
MSTSACGSGDLDLRPPEMQRSSMPAWLEFCPHCGYAAKEIAVCQEATTAVVNTPEYQRYAKDRTLPHLAPRFICAGMLAEASGDLYAAGINFVRAAWVFDDEQKDGGSREWRQRAATVMKPRVMDGPLEIEEQLVVTAQWVDCLRRTGQFAEGLEVIEILLAREISDDLRALLTYQRSLTNGCDTACHLSSEAFRKEVREQ